MQSILKGRLAKAAGVLAVAVLTMGTTSHAAVSNQSGKFVATAASLSPQPIPATKVEPIVHTTVVHVAAPAPSPAAERPNTQLADSRPFTGVSGANPYPYGQCTWYVYNQTGRGQNGNAGTWRATSSTPAVGKIMIYRPGQGGAQGAGHVAVVVGVNGNQVTVRSMNWGGSFGSVTTHTSTSTGLFY